MSAATTGLRVSDLRKSYGTKQILKGLSLEAPAGAITCLLGRNGAGKTTTMSCILGLRRSEGGEIRLDGALMADDDEAMRQFGYMPEEPALYDHLTGREFLEFIGQLYGVSADRYAWMDRTLSQLGLGEDRDRLIREYSMGMKRKISFLAATLHDPRVLVLDEPTGGLDAPSAKVLKELLDQERSRGKVILFTTHVMELAERMANRVAIIRDGTIVLQGSTADVLASKGPDATLEDVFLSLTHEG